MAEVGDDWKVMFSFSRPQFSLRGVGLGAETAFDRGQKRGLGRDISKSKGKTDTSLGLLRGRRHGCHLDYMRASTATNNERRPCASLVLLMDRWAVKVAGRLRACYKKIARHGLGHGW